jgi:hypothetical protein
MCWIQVPDEHGDDLTWSVASGDGQVVATYSASIAGRPDRPYLGAFGVFYKVYPGRSNDEILFFAQAFTGDVRDNLIYRLTSTSIAITRTSIREITVPPVAEAEIDSNYGTIGSLANITIDSTLVAVSKIQGRALPSNSFVALPHLISNIKHVYSSFTLDVPAEIATYPSQLTETWTWPESRRDNLFSYPHPFTPPGSGSIPWRPLFASCFRNPSLCAAKLAETPLGFSP